MIRGYKFNKDYLLSLKTGECIYISSHTELKELISYLLIEKIYYMDIDDTREDELQEWVEDFYGHVCVSLYKLNGFPNKRDVISMTPEEAENDGLEIIDYISILTRIEAETIRIRKIEIKEDEYIENLI